jgi:hypothetical protein
LFESYILRKTKDDKRLDEDYDPDKNKNKKKQKQSEKVMRLNAE